MKTLLFVLFLVWNLAVAFAQSAPTAPGLFAQFQTDRGNFWVQLDPDAAPLATTLFVGLAEGSLNTSSPGTPFYRNQTFHAVSPGVVVQGGDPTGSGLRMVGGPLPSDSGLPFDQAGILALFNTVPDQNGSQFFLSLRPLPQVQGRYPAFGRVVTGLDVLQAIRQSDHLLAVSIVRNGDAATSFRADKEALSQRLAARVDQAVAALAKVSEGTITTSTGLRYKVLKPGNGRKAKANQTVTADYEGRLVNGTVFDSSYQRKTPFQFVLGAGQVIKAWDEAVADMSVGEKRLLVVPPDLGYGERGSPPTIPPQAWLVFEVELVGIRG